MSLLSVNTDVTACIQKKQDFKRFPCKRQYKLSNHQNTMFTYVLERYTVPNFKSLPVSLSFSLSHFLSKLSSQQNTMLVQVPEQYTKFLNLYLSLFLSLSLSVSLIYTHTHTHTHTRGHCR